MHLVGTRLISLVTLRFQTLFLHHHTEKRVELIRLSDLVQSAVGSRLSYARIVLFEHLLARKPVDELGSVSVTLKPKN